MLIFWLYGVHLKALSMGIQIVNINFKCEYYFGTFNSKSDLSTLLVFGFQTPSEMSIKGIRVRCDDILTLLSIFKGTVNINSDSLV